MFIELHIIQNFAPSNLNRDDTGAPKDCIFGSYRRARISSQCLKRAVRTQFIENRLVNKEDLAVRTKRLVDDVADELARRDPKRERDTCIKIVTAALSSVKLTVVDENKTQYLLYLGNNEITKITELCNDYWERLLPSIDKNAEKTEDQPKKKSKKAAKDEAKERIPEEVRDKMEEILGSAKSADLALFGRMLADMPDKNVDAACQVAHAIGTNEVSMEMDFYTAVDDLKPDDTQGADMMGVIEFNSSCFYRYAKVDADLLKNNLAGDDALARHTIEAFIKASVDAVPTGKQNAMAAHNPPLYVRALARNNGAAWNLANAFLKPVRPPRDQREDIGELSIKALESHFDSLVKMYGKEGIILDRKASLYDEKTATVPELVAAVVKELS